MVSTNYGFLKEWAERLRQGRPLRSPIRHTIAPRYQQVYLKTRAIDRPGPILKKNISLINIKVIIIFTKEEFYPKIIHNQIDTKFKIIGGETVGIGHNNTLVVELNNVTQKKEITSTCLHI